MSAAYLAVYPWLAKRYQIGLSERKALYAPEKQRMFSERPLWVHAVSVGEVQSAWPLLEEVHTDPVSIPVVLSTTTPTGRAMAYQLTPHLFNTHIYYPWDIPWIIKRALDNMNPRAYAVIETEIWPNLLKELEKRRIPAFLVNGRFSVSTSARAKKSAHFWRDIYSCFTRLMVRSDKDADHLLSLGVSAHKIVVTGDCKVDALRLRHKDVDLSFWQSTLGTERPLFLAGSTHTGEDEIVLKAFRIVRERFPKARLIIVPRHPERAADVERLAGNVARTCRLSSLSEGWSILIVDKIGVLFELYGVVDSAFIGGSLVPKGGQNLMEAAAFRVPVCHGPHMEDFPEAAEALGDLNVSVVVRSADEMAKRWMGSLSPSLRETVQKGSRLYFEQVGGAARASWKEIREEMSI